VNSFFFWEDFRQPESSQHAQVVQSGQSRECSHCALAAEHVCATELEPGHVFFQCTAHPGTLQTHCSLDCGHCGLSNRYIRLYDSLSSPTVTQTRSVIRTLWMFIEYEHEQMHNSLSSWTGWSLEDRDDLQVICSWKHCMQADQLLSRACPQQKNKFNSGVLLRDVPRPLGVTRSAKLGVMCVRSEW